MEASERPRAALLQLRPQGISSLDHPQRSLADEARGEDPVPPLQFDDRAPDSDVELLPGIRLQKPERGEPVDEFATPSALEPEGHFLVHGGKELVLRDPPIEAEGRERCRHPGSGFIDPVDLAVSALQGVAARNLLPLFSEANAVLKDAVVEV